MPYIDTSTVTSKYRYRKPVEIQIVKPLECRFQILPLLLFPRSQEEEQKDEQATRIVVLTMPVALGFTSHLLETLHSSRTKLDAYALRQKAVLDAEVQALEQERQKNQDLIGNHVRNLQAVQSERGFASEEGIAQRRRDLNSQQRQLQERIQELTKEQEEQEQIAHGNED